MKTKISVRNMISPKGNFIPNQFKIWNGDGRYFQSYNSIIAFIDHNGNVFLDEYYWDYSRTTSKYRNLFLGEGTETIKHFVKTGKYKLKNLN